jgi:GNAT superfamily N-acetyltransferase
MVTKPQPTAQNVVALCYTKISIELESPQREDIPMPIKPLPTGEEPPKGYESIAAEPQTDDLRVDCAFISQLAKIEFAEIEEMRHAAFSRVNELIGLTHEIVPFDREINILPGKEDSDKVLFRAYRGNVLVGYALVVIGWPEKSAWTIQHLVINPEYRLQGVGSVIVDKAEKYAHDSAVAASSLFAIPLEEKGTDFWKAHGYAEELGRRPEEKPNHTHKLIIYRKELSS